METWVLYGSKSIKQSLKIKDMRPSGLATLLTWEAVLCNKQAQALLSLFEQFNIIMLDLMSLRYKMQ